MELVSVVSACRNELKTIAIFLQSLDEQMYRGFRLEVVIADGCSTDGTLRALNRFAAVRPWIRVIRNARRIASTGLNAAIRATSGSVVIRMDAHTRYASDYLQACVDVLQEKQAAMVGGPMRIMRGRYWQNAIGLAYPSPLLFGGSRVYDTKYNGRVDSVLYGCWPRTVLEASGLFDEQMVRNQDDELAYRIVQSGGLIWQDSRIHCWYLPRSSLWGLAKQFFCYGFWKVRAMRKHRRVVRTRHLVPAVSALLFVGGALASLRSRRVRCLFLVGTASYLAAITLASAARVRKWEHLLWIPASILAFPTAHCAYAAGTLAGFTRFRHKAPLY